MSELLTFVVLVVVASTDSTLLGVGTAFDISIYNSSRLKVFGSVGRWQSFLGLSNVSVRIATSDHEV